MEVKGESPIEFREKQEPNSEMHQGIKITLRGLWQADTENKMWFVKRYQ